MPDETVKALRAVDDGVLDGHEGLGGGNGRIEIRPGGEVGGVLELIGAVNRKGRLEMTLRALEKEVLDLPARSRVRLAERILESLDSYADAETEAAWDKETERRVKEIESGMEKGISAERVMKDARSAVNEARRVSSTRRK